MKKLFKCLICICVLFFVGCSADWEIDNDDIETQISFLEGRKLSLTYHLGPVLIVDTIWVSQAWARYIKTADHISIRLHVTDNDCGCNDAFQYYIEENVISEGSSPIDMDILEKHADEIPGFVWKTNKGKPIQTNNKGLL
jgi:hypothetical protein